MSLRTSHISRNLRMNAKFLGLEVEDLVIISFIAISFLIVGNFAFPKATAFGKFPLNYFLAILTVALGVPFLSAFKYGKPRGYLGDFAKSYIDPKRRDCLSRDLKIKEPYLKELEEKPDETSVKKKEIVKK